MTLYGLANVIAKRSFSFPVILVGYFYIVAGWLYLLAVPWHDFQNPWPMGLVFFFGEAAGAYAFFYHNRSVGQEEQ
jgi:hypothetical protein